MGVGLAYERGGDARRLAWGCKFGLENVTISSWNVDVAPAISCVFVRIDINLSLSCTAQLAILNHLKPEEKQLINQCFTQLRLWH